MLRSLRNIQAELRRSSVGWWSVQSAKLRVTIVVTTVRKLEHRSYFSSFSSLQTLSPLPSLVTSLLYVPPNRPHSPFSLVFIVASSLT